MIPPVIEWDENTKFYAATCAELNFISSFGDTKQEVIVNLKDAINLMLELISE